MSNILIIKHGALGDLIQSSGAMKDIKEHYPNRKVFLLTSKAYSLFMSECPYIDGVLVDKRLPRWNLFFLYKLKNLLSKYNFGKVFDLQNSNRTNFYKKFILSKAEWSSSLNTLEEGQSKDFDTYSRSHGITIEKSNIKTKFVKNIDLSWVNDDLKPFVSKFTNRLYFNFHSVQKTLTKKMALL